MNHGGTKTRRILISLRAKLRHAKQAAEKVEKADPSAAEAASG